VILEITGVEVMTLDLQERRSLDVAPRARKSI
jgi:hypothetical protein